MNTSHPPLFRDTEEYSARHQAWAYLNRVVEGPNAHILATIWENDHPDPELAAEKIYRQDKSLPEEVIRATESRHKTLTALDDLHKAHTVGARLVTPDSDEWPGEALAESFHHARTNIEGHTVVETPVLPHALWVRGLNLAHLTNKSITIVGTRACTRYGITITRQLSSELASKQWTVISGGAMGIDIAAHTAALSAGGASIAVLASGIDNLYPKANSYELDKLATQGALVSEYPPGSHPARHRFLTRNRLAAALGQGTIVVEAAFRSGALNTVNWAEMMGKQIFAVPGSINSRASQGCHRLIRNNRAQLIETSTDVLESLEPLGKVDSELKLDLLNEKTEIQKLTRTELAVLDSTSETPASITAIAQESGLPIQHTLTTLIALTNRKLINRDGNHFYRTKT